MPGIHIRPSFVPAQEYRISMPLETHWQRASCEDIGCQAYRNGWKTVLPVGSDLIGTLKASGRAFREEHEEAGLVTFVFAAGQPCFQASRHVQQTERPGLFIHRNLEVSGRGQIVSESEWIERNQETLAALEGLREK